jgi:hypothetical protein
LQLTNALKHCGSTDFEQTLKAELENLPTGTLPLQQATSQGGIVDDSNISVSILSCEQHDNEIKVRAGVFFTEIVAGCNCSDPPMETNGYCLLKIVIDAANADTRFTIIPD